MAFKFVALAALLAVAHAGGPAAYSIATAPADYGSVGYTQESTHKGYAGQNVVSSYSKAVDSPHSSVRVSNSRVTNDALISHHAVAPVSYAAPSLSYAAHAPAYGYASAPVVAKAAYSPATAVSYSTISSPLVAKAAYGAPALSYAAHAAPALSYATHAAPALSYAAHAAPALSYAAHGAPVLAKAAYAAPAYGYAPGAPIAHATFTGLGANYAW
ncbi:cuticle protein 21.3 isoform X2 [Cephus cinctus]|uniref:Cuticle protein 21.3 isoform X2 n=1 Tax=Cephus cinctus TaxID=211228 RepID=A0AAJ7FRS0_CEPCN|nr:cuticle protein 21.3 isoform X2 [Cephus cinctus]